MYAHCRLRSRRCAPPATAPHGSASVRRHVGSRAVAVPSTRPRRPRHTHVRALHRLHGHRLPPTPAAMREASCPRPSSRAGWLPGRKLCSRRRLPRVASRQCRWGPSWFGDVRLQASKTHVWRTSVRVRSANTVSGVPLQVALIAAEREVLSLRSQLSHRQQHIKLLEQRLLEQSQVRTAHRWCGLARIPLPSAFR